jgi:hypothetical protein
MILTMLENCFNISISYTDNDAKWMLIKNAPRFAIKNNIDRRFNLNILRDEIRVVIVYYVSDNPTDHYELIPVMKNLKEVLSFGWH